MQPSSQALPDAATAARAAWSASLASDPSELPDDGVEPACGVGLEPLLLLSSPPVVPAAGGARDRAGLPSVSDRTTSGSPGSSSQVIGRVAGGGPEVDHLAQPAAGARAVFHPSTSSMLPSGA